MSTYVSLLNWTEQGVKNFRDSTHRAQDFTNVVEKTGGHVREILWTIGEYDLVCVMDVPDDETLTATLLQLGEMGNVRTKTMRGFTAEQMDGIIERAG
jgi:uncharacterized protein with GYD domain